MFWKDVLNVSVTTWTCSFPVDRLGTVTGCFSLGLLLDFGVEFSWWLSLFWEEKGFIDITKSIRSDDFGVAWKADNSSIYTHFQVLRCIPSWFWAIKIFSESYEYIGKKGRLDFTYRYSPGRCKQYYFSLCLKWLKSENQVYKARKDVLTDLMKRDASGNLLGYLPCILVKNRADGVGGKERLFKRNLS